MEYNTFENQIKNTLLAETHLVDINALNMAIHAKKDKKRRILFFILSSLILVSLASFFLISSSDISTITEDTELQDNDKPTVQNHSTSKNTTNTSSEPIVTISNNIATIKKHTSYSTSVNSKNAFKFNTKTQSNANSAFNNINQILPKTTVSITNNPSTTYTAIENNQITQYIKQDEYVTDYLPSLDNNISSITKSLLIKDDIICPSFKNKSKLNFSLIPEIGLIIPQKTLSRNLPETGYLLDLRDKNESSRIGYQAAIYGMLSKQGLPISLKVGFSYTNFAERMKLDYNFTKIDTTIGIISITKSQTGDTITTIYGDVITQKRMSGGKVIHHTISSIDIPVGLNVSKRLGAFALSAGAGVYLNLSTSVKGRVLVSDTSFIATDAPIARYRSNLGLSYYGELLLTRSLGRAGSIYLGGRYRYIPQRFSTPINEVNQNYSILGLNLGYIYTL